MLRNSKTKVIFIENNLSFFEDKVVFYEINLNLFKLTFEA